MVKHDTEAAYIELCRSALHLFAATGTIPTPSMIAFIGAADALSQAAARGSLAAEGAVDGLASIITATVFQPGSELLQASRYP